MVFVYVNFYNFNYITYVKKVILKVSYKTIWSRSRNSELWLRGAGAERNIFGSATLVFTRSYDCVLYMNMKQS
jgi:hypothetical protein